MYVHAAIINTFRNDMSSALIDFPSCSTSKATHTSLHTHTHLTTHTHYTCLTCLAGLGLQTTLRRFVEVMAVVWAGSQVTKLARAAAAIAFAPLVDKALISLADRLKLKSKGQAFGVMVAACFGVASAIFVAVLLAWS